MQTQQQFLKIVEVRNPNTMILSLYKGDKEKVQCKCKICGHTWIDSATHIKQGRSCGECKRNEKQKQAELNFYKKAKELHKNKYSYDKFIYINSQTKGIITCPIHGDFEQIPNSHLRGRGCPKCADNNERRTTESFIKRAIKIHNNKFDYSLVNYKTCKDPVKIICNTCKHTFEQTPDHHLQREGCPYCKLKSQRQLFEELKVNFPNDKILFEVGKSVLPWLENQRVDILFPDLKIIIEYDGEQHYIPIKHFGGTLGLLETQYRDKIKDQKAAQNNYKLYRIKYNFTQKDYINLMNTINNIKNLL